MDKILSYLFYSRLATHLHWTNATEVSCVWKKIGRRKRKGMGVREREIEKRVKIHVRGIEKKRERKKKRKIVKRA